MALWSKEFLLEFIKLFRSLEMLWKVKSKDYYNKKKRNDAYNILLDKVKTIQPDADRNTVTKRLNSLRSAFRKELKMFTASQTSGANVKNINNPKLWYYEQLAFLKDQKEPSSSLCDENDNQDGLNPEIENLPSPQSRPESQLSSTSSTSSQSGGNKFKRKRPLYNKVLNQIGDRVSSARSEDEFDVIGKNVANKLRKMKHYQKIFCQKLINDAIFEGEMETLTRQAKIHIQVYERQSQNICAPWQSHNNIISQRPPNIVNNAPSQIVTQRQQPQALFPYNFG